MTKPVVATCTVKSLSFALICTPCDNKEFHNDHSKMPNVKVSMTCLAMAELFLD